MASGFYNFGFSTMLKDLSDEFDKGRAVISLILGLALLEGAILGPFQGYLIDRFGPRRIMVVGITLFGLGFVLVSTAQSITLFILYYILFMGIGSGAGTVAPGIAAVANWFVRKRGLAIGIVFAGVGLGVMVVNVTGFFVDTYGWRTATLLMGVTIWIVGYPLVMLMRHRPEDYGYLPDGGRRLPSTSAVGVSGSAADAAEGEGEFTARQALSAPSFWLVGGSGALRNLVAAGSTAHFIPAMTDLDFSLRVATSLFTIFGVVIIPVRLLTGLLLDRFEKRLVGAGMVGSLVIPLLLFQFIGPLWLAALFLVLLAVGWGGSGIVPFAMRGDYFGRRNFATINGFGTTVDLAGVIVGPFIAGLIFDWTGTYNLAFLLFAGAAIAAAGLMLLAKRPQIPARAQS